MSSCVMSRHRRQTNTIFSFDTIFVRTIFWIYKYKKIISKSPTTFSQNVYEFSQTCITSITISILHEDGTHIRFIDILWSVAYGPSDYTFSGCPSSGLLFHCLHAFSVFPFPCLYLSTAVSCSFFPVAPLSTHLSCVCIRIILKYET